MAEIKLQKRAVYAGDVHIALLKAGWSIADATKFVREMPTAEVEPVRHARWVWDIGDVYGCSCCGEKSHVKEVMEVPDWGWCPNCGARMDLGGADNG